MAPAAKAVATRGDRVPVGRIAGAFGVRGELKCDPTGPGRELFTAGRELYCVLAGAVRPLRLRAVRPHKRRLLIFIDGVEDAAAAADYAGTTLYAPRGDVRLDAGEYLDEDLIGCEIVTRDATPLGAVQRVEHYPSSDMLVVARGMIPMVSAIVHEIDLARRRIVVDPPEGLLE